MTDIYNDGTYLGSNVTWHEEDSAWKAEQIVRLFNRNSLNPRRVCEVGCGRGEILKELAERFVDTEFCGYEISTHAFEISQSKARENLSFVLGDVFAGDQEKFEVVMAIDVFEHVENYLGFLQKLNNLAKLKIYHIPLDLTLVTILIPSRIKFRRDKFGHLHYFTKETALRALRDTGHEVIDTFYTGVSIGRENASLMDRVLSFPRRVLFAINRDFAARTLGGYSLMVLAK